MKLLDPNDPFFRSPAIRWGTVIAPAIMAGAEFVWGGPGWAVVFAASAVFAFWVLIVKGPDSGPDQD
jgi:hypothetical protein